MIGSLKRENRVAAPCPQSTDQRPRTLAVCGVILCACLVGCSLFGQTSLPPTSTPIPAPPGGGAASPAQEATLTWVGIVLIVAGLILYGLSLTPWLIWLPRTAAIYGALAGVALIALTWLSGPIVGAAWVGVAILAGWGLLWLVNVGVQLWDARQAKRGRNRLAGRNGSASTGGA